MSKVDGKQEHVNGENNVRAGNKLIGILDLPAQWQVTHPISGAAGSVCNVDIEVPEIGNPVIEKLEIKTSKIALLQTGPPEPSFPRSRPQIRVIQTHPNFLQTVAFFSGGPLGPGIISLNISLTSIPLSKHSFHCLG
jgi:hypothetical protein